MLTDIRSKGNNEANTPEVFSSATIPSIYAKVVLSSIFPLKVTTKKSTFTVYAVCYPRRLKVALE